MNISQIPIIKELSNLYDQLEESYIRIRDCGLEEKESITKEKIKIRQEIETLWNVWLGAVL